ncbi:winged helix DNA-binding domain-containing protein [Nocardioides anomalus]|uniref:Winged helix DNA-binding domain-containing protein n=1 Tax=Nocardioides anomalus TaxID=2712223 RepID=A0A6G6W9G9_9ACTN|nr:crosslink repair DNA glycosylase YcaQ family protein [Nocardioides anomalus]QIG41849.1 winged helix DNA-binding domain-containing protein [Nocardioides anomalus]
MSAPEVSWPQALAWRLDRHLLSPVGGAGIGEVVRRLGAVLSTDAASAELAVRTRMRDSTPGDLARAHAAGEVIEVFAFRGAVHHLSPVDGADLLALRCAGRQWERASWVEHYRLSARDWPAFRAAVREALDDGPLTLAELGAAITARPAYRHLAPVFADGAGTLVKPLTWQGDVEFGPPRDGRASFRRLDANPHWPGLPDLEEAGPRAVLAYVRAYGPTTREHVQYWLGAGLSAGRRRLDRWLDALPLARVDVDGTQALVAADDLDDLRRAEPSEAVVLLPGHDAWVMGPGTKDTAVTPPGLREAVTRKAHLVVAGGVVRGTWTTRKHALAVTWLDDTAPVPRASLAEAAERAAGLLGVADLDLP